MSNHTAMNAVASTAGESYVASSSRVLGDWLREEARADPNRKFVQCGSPWMSLAELDRQSDRLAAGLQSIGLEKGDRLAIMLQNRIEYVILVFACAKAGVVQVPINPYLRGEFLRHQLAQSQSRVIVADGLGMQQIAPLVDQLPELRHRVLVGEPVPGDVESPHDKLFSTLAATQADLINAFCRMLSISGCFLLFAVRRPRGAAASKKEKVA